MFLYNLFDMIAWIYDYYVKINMYYIQFMNKFIKWLLIIFSISTSIDTFYLHDVRSLNEMFPSAEIEMNSTPGFKSYNRILGQEEFIIRYR